MIANTPSAWNDRAEIHDPAEAVRWSRMGQSQRFRAVLDATNPRPGETVLDFGCGTGALADMLPHHVAYTGYDWAGGMITRARHDHPTHKFTRGYPISTFDITVCVGPFNLTHNWSKHQTWEMLERLWNQTGRVLAACLYAGTDPECLIYTEEECGAALRHLRGVGARNIVRHRPNDLLLTLDRHRPPAELPARIVGGREDRSG